MRVERATEHRSNAAMRSRIAFLPDRAGRADPFLALAEDWVAGEGGFPEHPHRGFETVTLVLEGVQEHRDSMGHAGVLHADDVQWMTAGRGVLHSEMPRGGFHGLQLWVNLPAWKRLLPARYQDLRVAVVPTVARDGTHVRVIAGEHGGVRGVAETNTSIDLLDVRLEDGARLERPGGRRRLAYVVEGFIEGHGSGSVLYLEEAETVLHARGRSRLLWMEGEPIGESIVARGPFVMNTAEEISAAYRDLREGRLTG